MMSSKEEKEDENGEWYFAQKIPSFWDTKFQKLVDVIDKTYIKIGRNVQKNKWWKEKIVLYPWEGHQDHLTLVTNYLLLYLQFLLLIIKRI